MCNAPIANMINNRIAWIDLAKGYGMLFVIMGHLEILNSWVYTFHMPLFFFLSGYVFKYCPDFKVFVKRKFKSLIVPYFFLGIPLLLYSFLALLFHRSFSIPNCLFYIKQFFVQERFWTLWFLTCLFGVNVIWYCLLSLFSNPIFRLGAVLCLCSLGFTYHQLEGCPLPWNIDLCFPALPFFGVGYLSKNQLNFSLERRGKLVFCFLLFITVNLLTGYLNYVISGQVLDMYTSSFGYVPLSIVSAFAGIGSLILFCQLTSCPFVEYIGRNSLIYLAWHQTIIMRIISNVFSYLHGKTHVVIFDRLYGKVLSFALIIIILTGICMILSKLKIKTLFGLR